MSNEEIIKKVNEIFIDVLENDSIVINDKTTAYEIDEWDSLNHIMLVVEIEKQFAIRFSANEVQGFKNVGEMCAVISLKIK